MDLFGFPSSNERCGTLLQVITDGQGNTYTTLAGLNDSGRFTFPQIADIIEAQFGVEYE